MAITETKKGVCVSGFKAAGVREGKYGVALITCDKPCCSAGVFTQNSCRAAPVVLTERRVKKGIKAVIANSGCANACVKEGIKDAVKMSEIAGSLLGIKKEHIGVASTGIIGRRINLEIIQALALKAGKKLSNSPRSSMAAAKALMTTDTKPKQVSVRQKGLEVGGICKGAGMIAPEMATMLCFITTNADIKQSRLQKALEDSVEKSFNMTLVDGDTSTNDTVILISSCRRKCSESRFQKLLDYVTTGLAKKIAQDGEGASKYLEFEVKNAGNPKEAREVARALAASPLVKTAFYGENPNWGRIISTIGNTTGVNPMKITINYSSRNGTVDVFNQGRNGDLKKAEKVLKQKGIRISVNLRKGKAKAVSYTCDLTEEYVKVNAGYS